MSTSDIIKTTIDVTSYGIVLGALADLLPPIAALASLLWVIFQFYHSEPMKAWRLKRKKDHASDT